MSLSDSKIGWKCSQIIPDGPGAAPLHALNCGRKPLHPDQGSLWNSTCDFRRPGACCRRSKTSTVLRRTSRTGLPTFSLGPTLHGTGGSATCAGGGRRASILAPASAGTFMTCGYVLQSHAQCCPEPPLKKNGTVFIACARHSNNGHNCVKVPENQTLPPQEERQNLANCQCLTPHPSQENRC